MSQSLDPQTTSGQRPVAPSGEVCFANAQVILTDRVLTGAVHVADGVIAEIVEGDAVPPGALDLKGDMLLPGLVELHTDNLEHHIEPRPTVELPHTTAILAHDGELASVGITTVFDALRVGAIVRSGKSLKRYAREVATEIQSLRDAGVLRIRHLIHLRAEICSETLIEELAEFGDDDRVGLISMMDHTPGQRQFSDLAKFKTYHQGRYGSSHAEFDVILHFRKALGDRVREAHQQATLDAAKRMRTALASHDDTTPGHVQMSKDMGISLAEFPTTLDAALACREAGIKIVMGAPNLVRGTSHSGNVSAQELARRGLLDIMSSDYVPSLLLASAFQLADIWNDLPRAIGTVTHAPADATGLTDRGRIAVGGLADLVRVSRFQGAPVVRSVWRGGVQVA